MAENCIQIEVPYNLYDYLNSTGSTLQNICRICLTPNKCMVSLLTIIDEKKQLNLIAMLNAFTSIDINPDADMPVQICVTCKIEVINCYNFKTKCDESNYTLQSLLKGKFIPTDELIDSKSGLLKQELGDCELKDEKIEETYVNDGMNMDIVYLEDINDFASDDEHLSIVPGLNDKKKLPLFQDSNKRKVKEVNYKEKKKKYQNSKCVICLEQFTDRKNLKTHIKHKHSRKKASHPCNQCKQFFNSEHDRQLHLAVHALGPIWTCKGCSKEFKAQSLLRRHIQRHMEWKRFTCEACGKSFAEYYALRRHSRVHTGEVVEKKHICHICSKGYSESSQLSAHIARHSSERPFVCASCGKRFASARLLASHRLVHTEIKPFACDYCDKKFRHESTRNTHHRTHTGEKPFVCSVCGKTFIQSSNMRLHMRTHTGEKPYSCDKCEKTFSSGSSLKSHMRTHTGEKPYSCKICNKRFARIDLTSHMRKHTGERPHACAVCPKRFPTAARLRDHRRIHTGEKPYECASCAKKFPTKSHLVKHLKKHEPKIKKEKEDVVVLQHVNFGTPFFLADNYIISDGKDVEVTEKRSKKKNSKSGEEINENVTLEIEHDMPLEVTSELVVQDEAEVLVVDNDNYQSENIYLSTGNTSNANDVKLVAINEGGLSISAPSNILEGDAVKLYHLDQSLVQIHSSCGQVTISKITSKMTANY